VENIPKKDKMTWIYKWTYMVFCKSSWRQNDIDMTWMTWNSPKTGVFIISDRIEEGVLAEEQLRQIA